MEPSSVSQSAFIWALQALCALHRKPFSAELAVQQLPPPYTAQSFIHAAHAYAFDASTRKLKSSKLHQESFPLIVWLNQKINSAATESLTPDDTTNEDPSLQHVVPALVLQADTAQVLVIEAGDAAPATLPLSEFDSRYLGHVTRIAPKADPAADSDSETEARLTRKFGFRWFIPELLKHKRLWQEILLASLVIQLIALATPLFTQTIIDKVIVHHTQSTLIVIAIGMAMFIVFSASLSWLRQYLVLHTGNRVDAVLGSSVFERLFKLPRCISSAVPPASSPLVCKAWKPSANSSPAQPSPSSSTFPSCSSSSPSCSTTASP